MRTNIDKEIGALRAKWRMRRRIFQSFRRYLGIATFIVAVAILVLQIRDTYDGEDAFDNFVEDIARQYLDGGLGEMREKCGETKSFREGKFRYGCLVDEKKRGIYIEQFTVSRGKKLVKREKTIPFGPATIGPA